MHQQNIYVVGEMMDDANIYQSLGERQRQLQESPPNYRAATSFAPQQTAKVSDSSEDLPSYAEAIEKERY